MWIPDLAPQLVTPPLASPQYVLEMLRLTSMISLLILLILVFLRATMGFGKLVSQRLGSKYIFRRRYVLTARSTENRAVHFAERYWRLWNTARFACLRCFQEAPQVNGTFQLDLDLVKESGSALFAFSLVADDAGRAALLDDLANTFHGLYGVNEQIGNFLNGCFAKLDKTAVEVGNLADAYARHPEVAVLHAHGLPSPAYAAHVDAMRDLLADTPALRLAQLQAAGKPAVEPMTASILDEAMGYTVLVRFLRPRVLASPGLRMVWHLFRPAQLEEWVAVERAWSEPGLTRIVSEILLQYAGVPANPATRLVVAAAISSRVAMTYRGADALLASRDVEAIVSRVRGNQGF